MLFHRRRAEPAPEPELYAHALVDLYANGQVIRAGTLIPADDPLYMNTQWAFEILTKDEIHHGQ